MPTYRAYLLDRVDRVVGVQLLACLDDEIAISSARPFLDLHDIELWDGERLVARIKRDGSWTDATFGSLRPARASLEPASGAREPGPPRRPAAMRAHSTGERRDGAPRPRLRRPPAREAT